MVVHNLAEYVNAHRNDPNSPLRDPARPQAPRRPHQGLTQLHSKAAFDANIANVKDGNLVVLDCFATWCGPCKVISSEVVKFSESNEFKSRAKFYKIDVDEVPDVAQELGIRAMPTFLFFMDGEQLDEVVGANRRKLEGKIRKYLPH